jgi:mannose-6-phosphate isomerase-like protein (cupin superfamily)
MRAAVRRASDAVEFDTPERCWILEVANDADDPACSIARARVVPGVTTEWHWLDGIAERYVIVSGRGRVDVGDLAQDVGPGDVVRIPPNVRQRITSIDAGDLVFYAICTPRFDASRYRTANTPELC